MRLHEITNLIEGIRPPVSYAQVVTPQWIMEVLERGFDVGTPHTGAKHQDGGFDIDSTARMLDDLRERGTIPEDVDIDNASAVFPYVEKWFRTRFEYVIKHIEAVHVGNGYRVGRELRLSRASAHALAADDSPLGNFWSFRDGEAFWGDDDLSSVFLDATVSSTDIDWITTIRRNMNYTLGEEEQEVFLPSGTPIRLTSMKLDDGGKWITLPIRNPNRKA